MEFLPGHFYLFYKGDGKPQPMFHLRIGFSHHYSKEYLVKPGLPLNKKIL